MAYVMCIGCNRNCDLDTADDNLFYDDGDTYDTSCYCPCGSCWTRVDREELRKAYESDNNDGY